MRREPKYRVVGVQEDGNRVVITKNTTREIAEKIVKLMTPGTTFAELLIEEDDGAA
jgi:hypothetical protein